MAVHCHTPEQAAHWLRQRVTGTLRADSRALQPGDGFIAWPGEHHDGRRHAAAALRAGAAACLVDAAGADTALGAELSLDDTRLATLEGLHDLAGWVADAYFEQPSRHLDVLGVTGTNGKTSTTWWLAQALSAPAAAPRRAGCGLIGTLGIGLPGVLHSSGLTTPDAVSLQAALRGFVDAGLCACAIEASSIGLQQQRLAGVRVAVAVFTNLTPEHLDLHGNLAAYAAAKWRLFEQPGLRAAVLNIDDAVGATWAQALAGAGLDLWTLSLDGGARLRLVDLQCCADGLQGLLVEAGQPPVPLRAGVTGDFNARNLLGVVATLRHLGLSLPEAAARVAALDAVPGRLQRVRGAQVDVIVDYAHTPDALDQVLRTLRPLAAARGGRLWCVFGCGGDRDATKRPLMGAIAARGADRVVLTSDNPRHESPAAILAQILAGVTGHDEIDVIEDRRAAIHGAVMEAAAGDLVLLAGKGHETWQDVAGVRKPFSDLEQAQAALAAREAASCP